MCVLVSHFIMAIFIGMCRADLNHLDSVGAHLHDLRVQGLVVKHQDLAAHSARRACEKALRLLTIGGSHISVKAVHDRFYTYMCGQSRFDIDSTPICDPISSPYRAVQPKPLLSGASAAARPRLSCPESPEFYPDWVRIHERTGWSDELMF